MKYTVNNEEQNFRWREWKRATSRNKQMFKILLWQLRQRNGLGQTLLDIKLTRDGQKEQQQILKKKKL